LREAGVIAKIHGFAPADAAPFQALRALSCNRVQSRRPAKRRFDAE